MGMGKVEWYSSITILVLLFVGNVVGDKNNTSALFGIVHCDNEQLKGNKKRDVNSICVCSHQTKTCGAFSTDLIIKENITMDVIYLPSTCSSVSSLRQAFPTKIVLLPVLYIERLCQCLCLPPEPEMAEQPTDEIIRFKAIVIASVMKNIGWKSFVLIHNNETALVSDLVTKELSLEGITHIRYRYDTVSTNRDMYQNFRQIYDKLLTTGINVTIICQNECAQNIIYQANKFDELHGKRRKTVLNQKSRWLIITSLHRHQIQHLASNITKLDNVVLLNMKPVSQQDIKNHENLTVNMECEIYYLQTLMWSREGRRFDEIGYVTDLGNLHLHGSYYPNEKFCFNGREFLITTNVFAPFVLRKDNGNVTIYSGFCIDLLRELARQLNFTYVLTEPADGEWGTEGKNGTWTGIIGQLQKEEVDFMVAPASLTSAREMVMDFTYPYYFDSSTFLMRRPDPNQNKWLSLLSPLNWQVLVAVACVLPVCALMLAQLERFDPSDIKSGDTRNGFHLIFWYLLGALLQEGGHLPTLTPKGRIFISFWWIFSIVLVATYTGNLVAFMTVNKSNPPFTTFDGLASQTKYKWSVLEGTIFIMWFNTSHLQTFQNLWKGLERESAKNKDFMHPDPEVHIQRVLAGDYVLIESKTYMEMKSATDCRLLLAEEEIPNMSYGVGLPNNSPYTEIFSKKILELHENGILQIIKEQNWPKGNQCKDRSKTNAKAIALRDIQSAFYLLAAGLFVAAILLIIEWVLRRVNCIYTCLNERCLGSDE